MQKLYSNIFVAIISCSLLLLTAIIINFNFEVNFNLENQDKLTSWIHSVIISEDRKEGEINYIFCNDEYLHKLNVEFLDHDTLTDIISFDYTVGKELHGDIFISIDRVIDNANDLDVDFVNELHRVMIHGILHYCGYKDKSREEKNIMRDKEDYYLKLLT